MERQAMNVTVVLRDKRGESVWAGCLEDGVIRFDFENHRGKRTFFVIPHLSVMMCDELGLVPQFPDRRWYVHIVDAAETETGVWQVHDREIDIYVQDDLRTYRVVDMDEFAEAVAAGKISPSDACRLLVDTQRFLDHYLHRENEFPPKEITKWLVG
jgi:hypothetical protein